METQVSEAKPLLLKNDILNVKNTTSFIKPIEGTYNFWLWPKRGEQSNNS